MMKHRITSPSFALLLLGLDSIFTLTLLLTLTTPYNNNNISGVVSALTTITTTTTFPSRIRSTSTSTSMISKTILFANVEQKKSPQQGQKKSPQQGQKKPPQQGQKPKPKPKQQPKQQQQRKKEGSIPNIQSLRDDIHTWSRKRSPNAADEAANALRLMFRFYSGDNDNKTKNVNMRRPTVDVIDCNQVVNAWSKSRKRDAHRQAHDILKLMSEMYKKDNGNNICIRPDVITYTSVINAFAQKGDFDGASAIFKMQVNDFKQEQNLKARPNVYTFNAMINACSKSNRDDLPEIAEKLLSTINNWYSTGEIEEGPNDITYNSVINCWSKSKREEAPERVLGILKTMVSGYNDDGNKDVRPSAITYSSVLNAYARKGDIEGATAVWKMMEDDYHYLGCCCLPCE